MQSAAPYTGIIAGAEKLVRIHDIHQMVRDSAPLILSQFRRSHIEAAVDLQGVAVDDLATYPGRDMQRKLAFARGCGPQHDRQDQRIFLHVPC